MALIGSPRSSWLGGAIILTTLLFFFQSSSISDRTSVVSQVLSPVQDYSEPSNEDIKAGLSSFPPGEYTHSSALEHSTSSTLNGAPDNDLYEAWHAENKKPLTVTKSSDKEPAPQDCPVCPEPIDMTMPAKNEDRPLILYAYFESQFGRQNLQFFVDHGLHAAADFIFILNGPTDADTSIIFKENDHKRARNNDRKNVMVKKRDNTCFDLGAHAEVLNAVIGGDGWSDAYGPIPSPADDSKSLKDRYKRYILMNASIRGPFVPLWSDSCWSDAYLNKVTTKIKLVGMSYNCHTDRGHVQSMIWATDSIGLSIILTPGGIDECFTNMPNAQNGEIRTTQLLRDKGYDVDVFLSVYHSKDVQTKQDLLSGGSATETETELERTGMGTEKEAQDAQAMGRRESENIEVTAVDDTPIVPGDFWKSCTDEDWLGPGSYFGTFVHPYENLFMKSHRHIEDIVLDRLTEWHNGWGYSSYDVCF